MKQYKIISTARDIPADQIGVWFDEGSGPCDARKEFQKGDGWASKLEWRDKPQGKKVRQYQVQSIAKGSLEWQNHQIDGSWHDEHNGPAYYRKEMHGNNGYNVQLLWRDKPGNEEDLAATIERQERMIEELTIDLRDAEEEKAQLRFRGAKTRKNNLELAMKVDQLNLAIAAQNAVIPKLSAQFPSDQFNAEWSHGMGWNGFEIMTKDEKTRNEVMRLINFETLADARERDLKLQLDLSKKEVDTLSKKLVTKNAALDAARCVYDNLNGQVLILRAENERLSSMFDALKELKSEIRRMTSERLRAGLDAVNSILGKI